MISRDQIHRLIERPADGTAVLSVFLDMSVNSNNKRTYQVFLNKEKASFSELDSDRDGRQEALGAAFAQLEEWLDAEYDESKKGVAFYASLDGEWSESHQVSVPVPNRMELSNRPVVGPLVEIVARYHHHGVVVVDREHLRLLSFFLDQTLHEKAVETEPYPTSHDVKRGGFSARDYQARKEEETKHFFKEFAGEVDAFVRRFEPDDLILLGTSENVKKFGEFLPSSVGEMVVHTGRVDIDASHSEIRRKLASFFETQLAEEEARAVDVLRERVQQSHKAVAGLDETLHRLQEGKLETLVFARGLSARGGRCSQCGFALARTSGECPYCGGEVSDSIDLGEELLRKAEDQELRIDFVEASAIEDLGASAGCSASDPANGPVTPSTREDQDARRRVRFVSVDQAGEGGRTRVSVSLEWDGKVHTGTAVGERGPAIERRTTALATVEAVERVTDRQLSLRVIGVKPVHAFDSDLMVASLVSAEEPRRPLVGAALVSGDPAEAAALAVLSALNRTLGNFLHTPD